MSQICIHAHSVSDKQRLSLQICTGSVGVHLSRSRYSLNVLKTEASTVSLLFRSVCEKQQKGIR